MAKERNQCAQQLPFEKDVPNPSMCREGKGVRYFSCPHYDGCLDRAAKGMWSGFTCRECVLYRQREEDVW